MRRKSPEELKAQMAAFASENIEQQSDVKHVMENLDSIAAEGLKDVEKTAKDDEWVRKDGAYVKVPKGTKRTVATADDYVKFLRAAGGSSSESIQGRIHILKEYEAFSSDIERLKKELLAAEDMDGHPSFLGSGSNALVFSVENGGKRYAVRVPRGGAAKPAQIDSHLAGAVLSRGVPHLEQIVAASYDSGVTVAEMMPGKEPGQLEADEIGRVSEAQLADLMDTLVAARKKGINIDPKPSNFLYDPEAGFGIVDLHSEKQKSSGSRAQELGTVVGWGTAPLRAAGFYGRPHNPLRSAEEYARDLKFLKLNLRNVEAYRHVVEVGLSDPEKKIALEAIDRGIAEMRESVEHYSDDAWVADQMARATANERERIEAAKRFKEKGSQDDGWIRIDNDTI